MADFFFDCKEITKKCDECFVEESCEEKCELYGRCSACYWWGECPSWYNCCGKGRISED